MLTLQKFALLACCQQNLKTFTLGFIMALCKSQAEELRAVQVFSALVTGTP